MKQSLTKLVDVILEKLAKHPEWRPSDSPIRSWLVREGYKKPDIDAALQLVNRGVVARGKPTTSVRQLSDHERYRLSPDARAALARLEMFDLIDPTEREMILERLDQFEGEVSLADFEYLINWIIAPVRDAEHQKTIYAVLDNKLDKLH